MKIAIEARALSATPSGVRTYVDELIRHMLMLVKPDTVSLIYDSTEVVGSFSDVNELVVPRPSDLGMYRWLHHSVLKMLKSVNPDVVHFTKADIPKQRTVPTVVTIFDTIPLLFPESQSLSRRWYWPRALKRAAAGADHIITISDASRDDIVKLLGVSSDKITVTPLPVDTKRFKPVTNDSLLSDVRRKYNLPGDFILFVGTRDKRKNIGSLIRAFQKTHADTSHHLVIAGKSALKSDDSESIVNELGLEDRVHFIGTVDAEDLPVLYSASSLFVFPSVYEGWGFPVLEAMACGVPVVVSDGASLPQVIGEAGEVVNFSKERLQDRVNDEDFVERLADRMRFVLGDMNRRETLIAKGFVRVQELSWNDVAKQTLEVYRKVA